MRCKKYSHNNILLSSEDSATREWQPDLLLVLQKLLLLVVVKLLKLLELVVLLQGQMGLMLLQVTAYRAFVPFAGRAACSAATTCKQAQHTVTVEKLGQRQQRRFSVLTGSHDVGARGGRGHARGLTGDWVPGVGGRQAVQAL